MRSHTISIQMRKIFYQECLKKFEYSPDVIANLSKEGKIKGAEATMGKDAIYRAVKQKIYKLTISDLPHGRGYYKKEKNNPHTQTDENILNIARKINNMPRNELGYRTPLEVFESNLKL